MRCSICGPVYVLFDPGAPQNTICDPCLEGARSIIRLSNEIDSEKNLDIKQIAPCRGFENALKWMNKLKNEKGVDEKVRFLGGLAAAFKEQNADIMVRPGSNGPSIPAHKSVLAARSEIFKNMFDSDKCKSSLGDTITVEELDHEELETFIDFLYTGDLPKPKMEKHVYSLSIAADKYEIVFLQSLCEQHMFGSLCSSNVLDILETADTCSKQALKEAAIDFILKNMKDVVFSPRFDVFGLNNPHLSVQIIRASSRASKEEGASGTNMSTDPHRRVVW